MDVIRKDYLKTESLYEMLRIAMGVESPKLSDFSKFEACEWEILYDEALKQLLAAVVFSVIDKLPQNQRPSRQQIFQWALDAETVKGHNLFLNKEAARLTKIFAVQGWKSVILKGPANARLYPNPYLRQTGDIDIWVDADRESIVELIKKSGFKVDEVYFLSEHHIKFTSDCGAIVEAHYKPSSGNFNPITSRRLLSFLEKEIQTSEFTPEGFYVPSIKFALVMQLAHIQHHFFAGGIGLRQLVDYFVLLEHSTRQDRYEIKVCLKKFGLHNICEAVMWILGHILNLDPSKMLCEPSEWLGKKMLADIVVGGNFGKHKKIYGNVVQLWFRRKFRLISLLWFAPAEIFWEEANYWKKLVKSIPLRVRLRKVSLWHDSIWDLYEE